jgi:hypothetical protein
MYGASASKATHTPERGLLAEVGPANRQSRGSSDLETTAQHRGQTTGRVLSEAVPCMQSFERATYMLCIALLKYVLQFKSNT